VTMSSDQVAFNIVQPALPDAIFSYFNNELGYSVSQWPYLTLVAGICTRVVKPVSQLSHEWLIPLVDGELFDTAFPTDATRNCCATVTCTVASYATVTQQLRSVYPIR
jgi:hypothetical protein